MVADPAQVNHLLAQAYPHARCELTFGDPFQLLVATVLSAQSTDSRVNSVTPVLFEQYPDPASLAAAEQSAVEEIIRPTGLFRNKATALIGLSLALMRDHGGQVPALLPELVKLPGVGRKTANVVLGNAFGVPGITPDTHVIRLANRFGWVASKRPNDVEKSVAELFSAQEWVMVCHRIIWHGRRCCFARNPACGACVLADICPSFGAGETNPAAAAELVRKQSP